MTSTSSSSVPDGIDQARGTTTFNELVGLSRSWPRCRGRSSSWWSREKIGRKIPNLELPWSGIHTLVTDEGAEQCGQRTDSGQGITLICAPWPL